MTLLRFTRRWALPLAALILGACSSGIANSPPPATPPPAPESEKEEAEPPPPPPEPEPVFSKEPIQPIEAPPPQRDPAAPPDLASPPLDAQRSESGLQWKVLQPGAGTEHPGLDDTVTLRCAGWTTDGIKIESYADAGQSAEYVLRRSIPGWIEGLRTMVAGEKRRFWIPGRLAYGDEPRGYGLPYGRVVFDLELVSFRHPPAPPEVPEDLKKPPADATELPSGLVYRVLQKGSGKARPRANSVVEVHYSGWTLDGTMFDSSVARGTPASFSLGHVIRGWREGLQLMVVGERARFWIPAGLAYGEHPEAGSPAGPLVFDVELIAIKPPERP